MRITIEPTRVAETFSRFLDNRSFQESAQLFACGLPIAEMIQAFAINENVLRAFAGFDKIYPHGNLERTVLEKVILRVSQLHECQFCVQSHLDIMHGFGIDTDLSPDAKQTERERLAIEYAELVTRDSNHIPDLFLRGFELYSATPRSSSLPFTSALSPCSTDSTTHCKCATAGNLKGWRFSSLRTPELGMFWGIGEME